MVCVSHSGCWLYATWPADRYLSQPPSLSLSFSSRSPRTLALTHTRTIISHGRARVARGRPLALSSLSLSMQHHSVGG